MFRIKETCLRQVSVKGYLPFFVCDSAEPATDFEVLL